MGEFVRLEVADGVGTIRIDRPKMNALDRQTQGEIARRRGRGRASATTYARSSSTAASGPSPPVPTSRRWRRCRTATWSRASEGLQAGVKAVARIPKPVVAAVTGYALGGGCELALCADVRFAADNATLGQPEVLLGVIPGMGGTQRLTRLVGPSRAKDLIFTGRFIKADEALAIGMVDRVLPADEVYDAALAWARTFANAAPWALRAAKECIDRGLETDLETGLEIERQQFAALFATEDRTIGMTSFLENGPGKAEFRGA